MRFPNWCSRCHKRANINLNGSMLCGPCCNIVGRQTGTFQVSPPSRLFKTPPGYSVEEAAQMEAYLESVRPA